MRIPAAVGCVLLLGSSALAQREVALKPWVEVKGTISRARLGDDVGGWKPGSNFPYRATVSESGITGVYRLGAQTDTGRQGVFFGRNLQTGDLNGDGWTDVVVRMLGKEPDFIDTVMICWGNQAGIDTTSNLRLLGSNIREEFGFSILVTDLVGDASNDLVVGAPGYFDPMYQGRVYIYEGGNPFNTNPLRVLTGDSARYGLGVALAVGDLNDDGHKDLAVRGWYSLGSGSERFDYVDVWFGDVASDTVRDMRLKSIGVLTSHGLACMDANGDGIDDLLYTTSDQLFAPTIHVHYGGPFFSSWPTLNLHNLGVANFGNRIIDCGDMNGDGFSDITVAAYRATTTAGFVFVYAGGPQIDSLYDAAAGYGADSDFGESLAALGDVTGDGLDDVIVGAPYYDFGREYGYWAVIMGDSTMTVTGVDDGAFVASIFRLYSAYPNPFNPSAEIRYDLSERARVLIEVYSINGEHVATLVNAEQEPGSRSVTFDGRSLSSGTYFYRMSVTRRDGAVFSDTKSMKLIR